MEMGWRRDREREKSGREKAKGGASRNKEDKGEEKKKKGKSDGERRDKRSKTKSHYAIICLAKGFLMTTPHPAEWLGPKLVQPEA